MDDRSRLDAETDNAGTGVRLVRDPASGQLVLKSSDSAVTRWLGATLRRLTRKPPSDEQPRLQ